MTLSDTEEEKSRKLSIDSVGSVVCRKSRKERSLRVPSRITEVAEADPHKTKSLLWDRGLTFSRKDRAIRVSSSQEAGGESGVWLRVRIWNWAVFSFKTTVRAILDSLRDASQVFSASRRIIGSVSASSTSCSKVSSAEIDWVGRLGTTGFSSIPLANS